MKPKPKSSKLHSFLNHPVLKHSRFSKINLAIFILIFAGIGGYILLSGHAASSTANVFVAANGNDSGANCVRFATAIANPDPSGTSLCATFDKAYKLALAGDGVEVEAGSYPKQVIYGNSPKSISDGSCSITPTAQSTQNCVTFMPAPNATPAVAGLTIMTSGVRVLNLDFKDGGVGVAWLDNPSGVACKNVPQPHDIILDSIHAYISSQPAPGAAKGSISASGVYNVALVNSDIGPYYDGPGTGQFSNLTQASSSYCAAYPTAQLKDKNIYLYNNKWHDLYQTVVSNGTNCGSDPAQYFCNHMECIHWRASNSWIINNKFLNCAQNDVSVQTFGSNVPNIDNLQIIGNVFDHPCSNQPAPCGVVSALPIICSTIGDTVTNMVVAYNSIKGDAGFQKDSCTSPDTFAGSVVVGNLMQAAASSFSCSTKTSIGVAYAYNVWDPSSTAVCGPTDHILSGSVPWTAPAPPAYDFSLASGSEIANFVPKTVNISNKAITCPALDMTSTTRPAGGNNLCAAGAYEYVPLPNVWVSPTGNDTTCVRGDQTKPCATWSKAWSIACGGDIVSITAGTYGNQQIATNTNCSKGTTSPVIFRPATGASVTLDGLLTLGANNGQATGNAPSGFTLDGANQLTIHGGIYTWYETMYGSNITLENFHLWHTEAAYGNGGAGDLFGAGGDNLTLKNIEIGPICCNASGIDIGRPGASTRDAQNIVLDKLYVHDVVTSCNLLPINYQSNCTDTYNSSHHVDGLHIWGANGLQITNSKWLNSSGQVLYLEGVNNGQFNNTLIENNMIASTGAEPIVIVTSSGSGYGPSYPLITGYMKILYNTIWGRGGLDFESGSLPGLQWPGPNTVVTIAGNIGVLGQPCTGWSGTVVYESNMWSNARCSGDLPQAAPTFISATAPVFDLHLASTSAGINVASATNCPPTDIDGDARPIGTACDAGADEFTTASAGSSPNVPGDLTGDGHVTLLDLSILLSHYGQSASPLQGDLTGDGKVYLQDLSKLLSNYGK